MTAHMVAATVPAAVTTSSAWLGFAIVLGLSILNFAAIFKIITKAGYSGWWLLLPLAPVLIWLLAIIVVVTRTANVNPYTTYAVGRTVTFDVHTIGAWYLGEAIALFVNWIFFLVFAFSDWPVRRARWGAAPPPVAPGPWVQPPPYAPPVPAGPIGPSPSAPPPGSAPFAPPPGSAAMPPPPPGVVQAICRNCRQPLLSGAVFCGSCGTSL